MVVGEAMTREVHAIGAEASVREAAQLMAELDVGALPVGSRTHVEGIITDRDILIRVVAENRLGADTPVREVMSSALFCCRESDDAQAVLRDMEQRQVRRMPVVDDEGILVGMVTRGDILRAVRPVEAEPAFLAAAGDKPDAAGREP